MVDVKSQPMANGTLLPGTLMAAELAEQPEVLGRLVARHTADREQVRAVRPSAHAGIVLLARLSEITAPILAAVRGQQFALASSLRRGLNPDAPAGLSKVTATH